MPQLVRCKPCGYVTREDALGRVCPVCGFPRSVFEPYKDKVSAGRRFILNLDLHPIAVHFPQALASILPMVILVNVLFPELYARDLASVIAFVGLILPLTVVAAVISGLIDAKVKLKRLGTILVIQKCVVGSCLLAFSAGNSLILVLYGYHAEVRAYVLSLSFASLVCAVLLGMIGKKLIFPILPGKMASRRS